MFGHHTTLPSSVPEQLKRSLFEAARTGDADSLEARLRQHDEAIHATNADDGFTLLHAATNAGQRHIVNLLILNKASLNAASKAGYTALMLATAGNRHYIMADLMEAGANPDGDSRRPKSQSCLHIAAAQDDQGEMGPLHMLLVRGARVHAKDAEGRTPLHIAVMNGRLQAAKALVAFGADYRLADKQGRTAQDYAGELPDQSAASWTAIVKHWGKPDKQRNVKRSFKEITSLKKNWRGQFREMSFNSLLGAPNGQFDWIHVLSRASGLQLSRAAYESATGSPGEPREFGKDWKAIFRSHATLLEYGLSIPIDCTANKDDLLLDHLLHNCELGRYMVPIQVLERLLQLGTNPNATLPITHHVSLRLNPLVLDGVTVLHGHGFTPLHVAVSQFVPDETIKPILDSGGDLEARTDEGLTPFLLAAQTGNHVGCKGLVDHGANTEARAHDGRSVHDILNGLLVVFPSDRTA
ncbi:ankyrin repeat-containing domain protein [Apiospora saccharicola]